ncbi:LuxR C-terminal-related transcriptional regulator [Nocardia brevicatena]|uniref:LuxR C-terminal-related transcriptional regulator n=1 Tax=Nocardia brevicatena TaxID=37327 RepID=UPI0002E4C156|nr:LuxR C-terminal-related transcriptional regulator [Nocardia brevicatena]
MRETVRSLPSELSSFVGRTEEIAALTAMVGAGAVVTVVGPGGCGKTRLASRLCRGTAAEWPDGVVWVDLADEHDDEAVAYRIAAVLDLAIPEAFQALPALVGALADRSLLLVLDNCEQVVRGAAEAVAALSSGCRRLGILATGREPFGIEGERVRRVPPLDLADALELFLQRADIHNAGPETRAAARQVCDRLDRLPLALELAAGWAGTLSLPQLADSLREPYTVLGGSGRGGPFRQRTLAESMHRSHELLDADERMLFRRLAVFEPGFAMAAPAALGGVSPARLLRALRGLVDKSLVAADTTLEVARYRMLGVVREYALLRLAEAGETESVQRAHLRYYLEYVERARPLLDTDKDSWRAAIGVEYPNLRAAIERGLTLEPTLARRLTAGLAWFWHLGSYGLEGMRLLRSAIEAGREERDRLQAALLVASALVADTALPGGAGYDAARAAAELATETGAQDIGRLARVLCAVGRLGSDLDASYAEACAVRDDADRAGDGFVADSARALCGLVHLLRDGPVAAVERLEPAVDRLLRRGERAIASSGLAWLSAATAQTGELDRAAELAERAVSTAEPLRDFHRIGVARASSAEVLVRRGRLTEAAAVLAPIETLIEGIRPRPFVPGWERVHALLALARRDPDSAVDWCRRETRGADPDKAPTPWTAVVLVRALRARAGRHDRATEARDGPVRAARRPDVAAGRDLEAAAGILAALGQSPMVRIVPALQATVIDEQAHLLRADDIEQALRLHHEALRIRVDHGLLLDCVDSLEALAAVLAARGTADKAAILLGATERARVETGTVPGHEITDLRPRLETRLGAAFPGHLEDGRAMPLRRAIDYTTKTRGRRARPETGWESLTPTERSVVELAASGLSNPDIAARLFIGRGTVKTHLSHIYTKLGIANRTELARLNVLAEGDR